MKKIKNWRKKKRVQSNSELEELRIAADIEELKLLVDVALARVNILEDKVDPLSWKFKVWAQPDEIDDAFFDETWFGSWYEEDDELPEHGPIPSRFQVTITQLP